MTRTVSVILSLAIVLFMFSATLPCAFGQRPVITSDWTSTSPTIDGKFTTLTEWPYASPDITIPDSLTTIKTYVYFQNDGIYLYVMVDAAGDETDDENDECLLVFDFLHRVFVEIYGKGDTIVSPPPFQAAVGFDYSPNEQTVKHKLYEFKVPRSYIYADSTVDFCSPPIGIKPVSMPYDSSSGKDNVYPSSLDYENIETWALVELTHPAVGGELVSINTLTIIRPWIVLAIAVVAIGSVVLLGRKLSFP
jgi:hypothetical protein